MQLSSVHVCGPKPHPSIRFGTQSDCLAPLAMRGPFVGWALTPPPAAVSCNPGSPHRPTQGSWQCRPHIGARACRGPQCMGGLGMDHRGYCSQRQACQCRSQPRGATYLFLPSPHAGHPTLPPVEANSETQRGRVTLTANGVFIPASRRLRREPSPGPFGCVWPRTQ